MRVQFYLAALFLVLVYSMWKGGGPERAVGAGLIWMGVAAELAHRLIPPTYYRVDVVNLSVDASVTLWFLLIALHANRFWPLCVCSLQVISLTAHAARALDITIHPIAYAAMAVGPSYPIIALLAIGTHRHRSRFKALGSDPPWRNWLQQSRRKEPHGSAIN